MRNPAARWRSEVETRLGAVLGAHSLSLRSESSDNWGQRVVYANATTGLIVHSSIEFNRVEVSLVRLVEGEVPPYPIFVSNTPVLHQFLIDNLLALRAPELIHELRKLVGLGGKERDRQLTAYGHWLDQYAGDVLDGDFTAFAEMEREVRRRVALHPERIQVWVPEGTSADKAAEAQAGAGRVAPGIPVTVRRYWRWSRRRPRDQK